MRHQKAVPMEWQGEERSWRVERKGSPWSVAKPPAILAPTPLPRHTAASPGCQFISFPAPPRAGRYIKTTDVYGHPSAQDRL